MLHQAAHEPLERPVDGAVHHHDRCLRSVRGDVVDSQALRQIEVELDGRPLPGAADGVEHPHVDLRTIEDRFAFAPGVWQAARPEGLRQRVLRHRPAGIVPGVFLGMGGVADRQIDLVALVREGLQKEDDQIEHPLDLVQDLIARAVDVGVVLRESPHPHHAVQDPRSLVAVHRSQLGVADRQLAVRAQPRLVDQGVARAVHRLDDVAGLLDLEGVHVLFVVIEMTGHPPQLVARDVRRGDELVAPPPVLVLPEILQDLPHDGAVRVPEDEPRPGGFLDAEQIERRPEPAMVALFGLFEQSQVLLELLLGREGRAVDPLQLLVLLGTLPVGAGYRQQLERADPAGRGQVRTGAEVHEVVLPVARDHRAAFLVDELHLQVVAQRTEIGERLLLPLLDAPYREVLRLDLAHAGLDALEVLGCERFRALEIVKEALLGRGADADFHLGEQVLDRVRQKVRGGVPEDLQSPGRIGREKLHPGAPIQRQVDVSGDPVHDRGDGALREIGVQGRGDLAQGGAARERADCPAGQDHFHGLHGALSFQSWRPILSLVSPGPGSCAVKGGSGRRERI